MLMTNAKYIKRFSRNIGYSHNDKFAFHVSIRKVSQK